VEIVIASELPTSAGLGSSAAYSTCLAASFLELTSHIKSHSTDETSHGWSDHDCQLINHWAFQAEKIIHGNPSGIDNAVSCYGMYDPCPHWRQKIT
jgi:mevalonate kinase